MTVFRLSLFYLSSSMTRCRIERTYIFTARDETFWLTGTVRVMVATKSTTTRAIGERVATDCHLPPPPLLLLFVDVSTPPHSRCLITFFPAIERIVGVVRSSSPLYYHHRLHSCWLSSRYMCTMCETNIARGWGWGVLNCLVGLSVLLYFKDMCWILDEGLREWWECNTHYC